MFERPDNKKENFTEYFAEIENCKIISDVDRAAIVLTFEGVKPVSELDLLKEFESNEQEFEDSKKRLLTDLSSIGIFYKKEGREDELHESYLIAKQKEDLDRIFQSSTQFSANEDLKKYYLETGKLFGYPETAVNSFANNEDSLPREEVDKLESRDRLLLSYFIHLALSKENWRKELDVLHEQCAVIKKYMPDFYERVITSPEFDLTPEVFEDVFIDKEFKKHEELLRRLEKYLKRFAIKEIRDPQTEDLISTDSISKIVQENL